ncbi:MAG: DUF2796 domain-containing protein [Candidatus Competibacter sp.]|jgi:hypothetical protein|nr:DUF2796 domain-containing protein [Candidatus Competibacter sp.]
MKILLSLHIATALTLTSTVLFAAPPHVHGVGTLQLVLEENSLSVELRLPAINVVGFEHAPNDAQQKAAVQNAVALLKDSGQVLILPDKAQCKIESAVVTSELLDHEGHDGAHDDDHAHDSGHDHDDHDEAHDDDHDGHDHAHADFDVSYGFDCRHPTALKQITLRLFQQLPRLERLDVDMVTTTGQTRQRLVSGQNLITLP